LARPHPVFFVQVVYPGFAPRADVQHQAAILRSFLVEHGNRYNLAQLHLFNPVKTCATLNDPAP